MTAGGLMVLLLYAGILTALAFIGTRWAIWPLHRRLRKYACAAFSSTFWFLLGMAPLLVGLAVGGAALCSAAFKGFAIVPDHCNLHPEHPHLCWTHAAALLPQVPYHWYILAGAVGLMMVWLSRPVWSALGLSRRLRPGKRVRSGDGFLILPSRIPAAFVAGIFRPRAFLTSAAFQLLTPRERRIVGAHEREHIRRRDPLKLALLRMALTPFPDLRWIEVRWKAAAEIECDWASLAVGAGAEEVSSTILKLARSMQSNFRSGFPAVAYALGGETVLRRRVEQLLSEVQPCGPVRGWGAILVLVLTSSIIALSSSHHLLESVLGKFLP